MRLAFLGTPDFALPTLAALIAAGHEVATVYSQPPAQRGRGRVLSPSPVHAFAVARGLEVRTPASLSAEDEIEAFAALGLDAAVVVAFGRLLPVGIIDAPRLSSFNLHASLLPRWRGAAPIQRAIMAGDSMTGVCVMRMTAGLDEGPVLAARAVPIETLDTAGTLHDRLAPLGAALMVETLDQVSRGQGVETPQADEGAATYARKIRPAETRIRWREPAEAVDRQIRGLSPFPGAWFTGHTDRAPSRVKALLSRSEAGTGAPGELIDDAFLVACGTGAVRILRAQREGRAPQDRAEFLRGFSLPLGIVLD
jgi:methionyl-tRNA formyltransferase